MSAPSEPYEHDPDTGVGTIGEGEGGAPREPIDATAARVARTAAAEAAARTATTDEVAEASPADVAPKASPARSTPARKAPVRKAPAKKAPAKKAPARPAAKDAAGTVRATPARTRPTAAKKPAVPRKPAADPGPPPPLPSDVADIVVPGDPDLIVPPMPPLPVADAPTEATADEAHEVAKAPASSEAPAVDAEPAAIDAEPAVIDVEPDVHDAAVALAAALDADARPATPTAALTVRGLTKAFGDTLAVDGIDLTVPAGSFYGLVGPNGAGKTTTLSMIAGLLRPDKGSIQVGGVDAASDPQAAKRLMGVLPDRLRTFDRLTGRQLLYYYGILRGLPSAVVESRTADLARAFDLTDALGRLVSDYSAGMTKKVMLAGAMIHSPRLLVLDEPFEAVDPVSSAIILDILATYVSHGGTVILSSHGMDLVERVCSRVGVIVAGRALAEGTVDEVRGELTLEQRFIELAGGLSDVEGLEWLHTFSD